MADFLSNDEGKESYSWEVVLLANCYCNVDMKVLDKVK